MFLRKLLTFSLLLGFALSAIEARAQDISNGNLRLILNGDTGSFFLYFLSDPETMRYEPLFNSRQNLASFSSVSVNGRVYRLGDRNFRPRYERYDGNPSFVFESQDLIVRQVFTPVKTQGSSVINGVMITFNIQNEGSQSAMVGLRMLLDTELGEGRGRVPFITSQRILNDEMLIDSSVSGERFWISRGQNVSLMGSIINPLNPSDKAPDYVHFANWNLLNRAKWQARFSARRSFNNNSAVCYIYEPAELESAHAFSYTIFLTTEDVSWYNNALVTDRQIAQRQETSVPAQTRQTTPPPREPATISITAIQEEARMEAQISNESPERLTLVRLNELIDRFLSGDLYLNEQDMIEIENFLNRHR
ncbi:MAG: hypothetical protein FWC01_00980 [Treponema sp.]|nr:hypothetical protein [Treponema sp.]